MTTNRFQSRFLVSGILLIAIAGCTHHRVSHVDSSARLEERRERSVTEDPAVRGETPDGWLVPPISDPASRQNPPAKAAASPQKHLVDPNDPEIAEFVERFKNTKPPQIFQGDLAPGSSHAVDILLTGPSGLTGSAQWIGSSAPMKVTIAVNALQLGSGKAYALGTNRGGSYLKVQTPVGGHATMAITNTSNASVKVRIMLVATAR